MRIVSKQIAFTILLVIAGCLEPFDPAVFDNNQSFLVVDGIVTDQAGPYTVKLSWSIPLSQVGDEGSQVTGAVVTIEERDGINEVLMEISPGEYQTKSLQGTAGNTYRLIILHDGQRYESTWELLNTSPLIDSIYFKIESKGTTDIDKNSDGVQFYIDSHGIEGQVRKFRYEWVETWEIGVTYPTEQIYLGNDKVDWAPNPTHTCWKYGYSSVINLATTEALADNILAGHPLTFVTGEDERFTQKYSLLVRQYALNDDEYLFWKFLKESNEQLGSLFDKQPATVVGNMVNVSNPDEVVLGYFSAAGLQEERVFIKEISTLSTRKDCNIELLTLLKANLGAGYETAIQSFMSQGKIFYRLIVVPPVGVTGVLLSDPRCIDCTLKGGDLNKPEFWGD
jgi:hypothetical protein